MATTSTNGAVGNNISNQTEPTPISGVEVAKLAKEQLALLTGHNIENISGLKRLEQGWQVSIEVLELHRIPESNDVLATYELKVDNEGILTNYLRTRRYRRDQLLETI